MILPARRRSTASGLMMASVRSVISADSSPAPFIQQKPHVGEADSTLERLRAREMLSSQVSGAGVTSAIRRRPGMTMEQKQHDDPAAHKGAIEGDRPSDE